MNTPELLYRYAAKVYGPSQTIVVIPDRGLFHTAFHTRADRWCFWGLQDSAGPCEKPPRTQSENRGGRLVGATGFEPATTCTPSKCATRLRYAPEL